MNGVNVGRPGVREITPNRVLGASVRAVFPRSDSINN